MSISNLVPVLLIFLYLAIIFLIYYFKNINFNGKKYNKIDIDEIEPSLALYCYNIGTIKNLFNTTLLYLIKQKHFKLETKDEKTYISSLSNKNELPEYQVIVKEYIDEILNGEKLELKEFNEKLTLDLKYLAKTNKYYIALKNEANKEFGKIDFISDYGYSFIVGILYFMQFAFFIYNDFTLFQVFIISLPLSYINIMLSDKLKNYLLKLNKKSIIKIIIASIIAAVISCLVWIKFSTSNYILFHFVLAILTFMYPLFVLLNIYFIKTNLFYLNSKQKNLVYSLELLKKDLVKNNALKEKYYFYTNAFHIKHKFKDQKIKDYYSNIF